MKQKTALITGSATGLGKRTAMELARQGMNIVITYMHSEEKALGLAASLKETYGVDAYAFRADVSNPRDAERLVKQALEAAGSIQILVNGAGPYISERKKLTEYSLDEWHYLLHGNLSSVFYLSRLLLPHMRAGRWGRIINFGFDRADHAPGWMYRSAFAAAKTGLVSLTKTMALEEAEHGITVNMLCPGDIVGAHKEADIADVRGIPDPHTPVGRPGSGEDIARTIAFLCADDADFITGAVIQVTGGKDVLNKYRFEES
ncbi:SDR family oxidoreductase [Brevibacillus sp. SYP-B805]|uniref:SDR family oxidoreductase n=1 Tax=Brevibacillus sp. SYP-B805 TaxID=1578199 RepID=UPI0013EA15E3|nr:SDR family oxidoreductase [Brevibacillus sp. SYP-B805]NGQ93745.1 SDR family oxidoreductase [Brevibacillus sp. SYP-B805]